MKRIFLNLGIFLVFILFLLFLNFVVQQNIENLYINNYKTNFNLLSFLIKDYIEKDEKSREEKIKKIKENIISGIKNKKKIEEFVDNYFVQGIWFIKNENIKGFSLYPQFEEEILSFYKLNIKGKNASTLLKVDKITFLVSNFHLDTIDILVLSEEKGVSTIEINEIFSAILPVSEIVYFSVLDRSRNPIIFFSLFEDFLPLKGEGSYPINTPAGEIYHIEKKFSDKNFVIGYSLKKLKDFKFKTSLFLIFLILFFGFLQTFIFYEMLRFEKLKIKKDKEIEHLKEMAAISSGFSHEIKNSLNALALLSKNLEGEYKEIFEDEIERIKRIISSISILGKYEIEKKKINIKEIIKESLDFLKEETKNLKVITELKENETVCGDRNLLFIAFNNIIKNSFEANAKILKIWTQKKGNYRVINFMDDGVKVSYDKIDKIFNPFFSTKGKTGLGLYLVKKIIEIHEGKIEFIQKNEKIFKIYLKDG